MGNRFPKVFLLPEAAFAGLSADESKRLCREFGICLKPRTRKAAIEYVWKRCEQRLESLKRCQF